MKTHRLPSAVALAVLLAGGVAAAQPADPSAKAAEHYEQAMRFYEAGKYKEAIPEFQEAYALTGEAILLYNIAQAYRNSGDAKQALTFYKRYLAKDPNGAKKAEAEKKSA